MTPDPKPPARLVDSEAGKEKVLREGCRLTGTPAGAPPGTADHVDRFHLVGKDLGGDDVEDNIIGIVHHLHMLWEHGPHGKVEVGRAIWAVLWEWERSYVLEKKGVDYVRRYFGIDLLDESPGLDEAVVALGWPWCWQAKKEA